MPQSGGLRAPEVRGQWKLREFITSSGLRHERLDTLYFVLAGLNIITLCALLFLNHATLAAFRDGVTTSSVWSDRQNHLIELERRARAVDTPANDIFESHDVERERAKLIAASAEFHEQLASLNAHLGSHALSTRDDEVVEQLDAASELMSTMETISFRTLADFERGDERQASRNMALTDRTFRDLMGRLEAAASILERGRGEDLERQLASANRMQALELTFGVCAILVILFVVFAGLRVAALVRENSGRQRRMLDEISSTRDRLRAYADDVSHELRVPISRMRLGAELLLGQERNAEQYRRGIEDILAQCDELSTITEALLFIARAENTSIALNRTRLDLGRELSVLVEYFEGLAQAGGHEISLQSASGEVWADRILMQRAVSNLVRNALVHTPRGSRVQISANSDAQGAWIEVRDDGPGLSGDLLARVFDRFQRGGDNEGGAGLGLAIVKSIMDLHGGAILLTSERGVVARLAFPPPSASVDQNDERQATATSAIQTGAN